tara:strand:- start:178 stop:360 length:183 start_codon:yes stop_codon:yes gene_type:complete
MNIIKFILGIQACIAGVLVILYLLASLAILGIELEYMADDMEWHHQMMEETINDGKKETY